VAGWESLTETERVTSGLVAQGLNNQQVADRMYVSVHTVAFHLDLRPGARRVERRGRFSASSTSARA